MLKCTGNIDLLWLTIWGADGCDMKLDDFGRAPNPRRLRIYLAEKSITVPMEQIDLGSLQHETTSLGWSYRIPDRQLEISSLNSG
jgi:hypothetical protein